VPTIDRRTDEDALRAVIARLLSTRRDASPLELVELLGEHVLWGPTDPPAGAAAPAPEPAFAA
jgi:hypothetical protein